MTPPKLSHNGKHEDFINPNKGMVKSRGVIRDNFGAYWLATLISGVLTFAILHLTFSLSFFLPFFSGRPDPRRGENGRRAILLPPWEGVRRRREGGCLKRIGKDGGAAYYNS